MLMARCDPMKAMFQGHFRESTSRVIAFPGVKMYAFHILLCYIYSDKVPTVEPVRCLELLELANRLCMNRLVNLVEARVIDTLQHQDRYVKEFDYYQKCVTELSKDQKEIRPTTSLQANQQTGCLCFTSKGRRESGTVADATTALCRTEPQQPPL
ncbi:jg11595 [Pararge aegeria aegeria]|uniref:Jg11595 protein n=1 Tax=Pararge aegeria aegeria TaxID=348720 RepID=A0A8S4RZU4_9NEOP|nr:jg11595 [Pararge aegeria aegeria]